MKTKNQSPNGSRFEINDTARKIADLECTIRELKGVAAELDWQIKSEEARTGICDPANPGYSSFARSARERRERLCASINRLKVELAASRARGEGLEPSKTLGEDAHPGWSPQVRIEAARSRGAQKLPYGGDPTQAPDYVEPKGKGK